MLCLGLFLFIRILWSDIPDDWCPGERCLVCGRPHIWGHFTIQKTARLANLSGCSWTLHGGSRVDRPVRAVQQNQILGADPQHYLQVSVLYISYLYIFSLYPCMYLINFNRDNSDPWFSYFGLGCFSWIQSLQAHAHLFCNLYLEILTLFSRNLDSSNMEKPDISNIQRAMMVSAVKNLMSTW